MLVAGLAVRMGLLLLVLAVLSVPVFLFLTGMKGVDAVRRRLLGVMRIGHLFWSDQVFYAPGHTWVRRTSAASVCRSGSTTSRSACSRRRLGLKLPAPGTVVRAGEADRRNPHGPAAGADRVAGQRHRHARQPRRPRGSRRWCTATRTRAAGCSR